MLPQFPSFMPVTFAEKGIVESFTKLYDPYYDLNFFSLWSWNTDEEHAISELNGNLVISLVDCLTFEPVLTFLGQNNIEETIFTLFHT
ncbi:MAG: hypothetical protein LR008_03270 [Candidatus Pacebacteria bacterium]|nr:hypothetical protein [Candidatus Paceibacterota bacterium]